VGPGAHTITVTATNSSSTTNTCTTSFKVVDGTPPSFVTPTNLVVPTDFGVCTASVSFTPPVATDNCGTPTVVCKIGDTTITSPYTFTKGLTTVTCLATDGAGNTSSTQFTVRVEDHENPTIACPAKVTVPTDPRKCTASGVALGTPTTGDNCGVASVTNDAPATFPLGDTIVHWRVTDTSGNVNTCTQTVTVSDAEAPQITCPANVTVSSETGQCSAHVTVGVATATDNCSTPSVSGTRSDGKGLAEPYPVGTTTITWKAVDAAGNQSACTQTVIVRDTEKPRLTCPADVRQVNDPGRHGATVLLAPPAASDNCPGVTVTGARDDGQPLTALFPVGTTCFAWTALDASGNTASCQQCVTVPASLISGEVLADPGGLRAADSPALPLAGVTVELRSVGGALLATTPSGSGGEFAFAVDPPGTYEVAVVLGTGQVLTQLFAGPTGLAVVSGDHLEVTLAPGQTAAGLVFLVRSLPGAAISGRVTMGARIGCQPATGDQPVANLLLRLLDGSGQEASRTFTLDDGRYFFALPPAGQSYLIVPGLPALPLPGPGAQVAGGDALLIPGLQAGQEYPGNNFLAASGGVAGGPASIEGFALLASTGAPASGRLAGEVVNLRDGAGQLIERTISGSDGRFSFTGLPIARYTIEAIAPPGTHTTSAIPGQNGSLGADNSVAISMLTDLNSYAGTQFTASPLPSGGAGNTIAGTVSGSTSGTGAMLVLEQLLPSLAGDMCGAAGEGVVTGATRPDTTGHFQFANLPSGRYRLVLVGVGGGDAVPGPNAVKIDGHTLQVTTVAGVMDYSGNTFVLAP
jgi:hypothetical protein